MLQLINVCHTYAGGRKKGKDGTVPRPALTDVSFTVPQGEFVILSGPNGSGKSTLFRILCGLTLPSSGTITVDGLDLRTQMAAIRPLLGVVFQSPAIDKQLTVIENLRMQADLYTLPRRELTARCDEVLAWTDLKERLSQRVETLSGGLARQVELAKVLLTRPKLLLLDEPTTGLDPSSRRNFLMALRKIQKEQGITTLMTSHIFSDAETVDRVAILRQGQLLACDTPAALKCTLGCEVVVIVPRNPEEFARTLRDNLSYPVQLCGDEVRVEGLGLGAGVPLLENIMDRWRGEIQTIALKKPDLEDVFVHVTGQVEQSRSEGEQP